MAIRIHLPTSPISLLAFFVISSFPFDPATPDKPQVPNFAFSWLDDNNTFQAGDIASIKIKVLGDFDRGGKNGKIDFNPTLTVNGKVGNSSVVSGVVVDIAGDTSTWRILFTPIRVGIFNVLITQGSFNVFDSSLHFEVVPGKIYPSVCSASLMGLINEYEAEAKVTVSVVPRDAFGNNISSMAEDLSPHNFTVSALYVNGSIASMPNITHMGWNEFGYISIEFIAAKAGTFLLDVRGGNQTLNGSPLPFKVISGPLDVSNCIAKWKLDTKAWQIFSKMEIFIHQLDQYGNLVPGLYEFDADVVEKETNLSIPIADLQFKEVVPGIQSFSFSLLEPGNFLLTISDVNHNKSISNMPFAYTVFIGYCDGSTSTVNGSGLNGSVSGEVVQFSIYLYDSFQYPSFVEVESIQVQIVRGADSYYIEPTIHPVINGSGSARELSYGDIGQVETALSVGATNNSLGHSKALASTYNVTFTPEKSGIYDIYVFCGNVLLNGGHSFRKEVRTGEVNISVSGVIRFAPKVPKLVENEIIVQLMDSFSNPVPCQKSRLNLEITSVNKSGFSTTKFEDNNDGSYTVCYLAKDVGTYELCASFDDMHFSPCPFAVNVYSTEYFPKAYDDQISVWEDESVAFDVLANDYFAGHNATIVDFSKPVRGSLLQYGNIFRYTPYKDYYGNDSFAYTISDVNGNLASAAVNISVLSIPPQFTSFPIQLQAIEDMISPRYRGFSGFEIRYSDLMEKISVTLSAQHGTVFLSPMPMQFWQPIWNDFSIKKAKNLVLEGSVEVINLALQSIQYLGNGNFSGNETLRVTASNLNGKNDLDVEIFVEPINDPPLINVPKYIMLKSNGDEPESLIFDKARDKFEFSVGDPDLLNFPGAESQFIVKFSVEVDEGFLVTSLRAELIGTTELKLMNSYQWQPLQTYVTISKHFVVKANGIRFRGTIADCNSVMEQLSYHGGENDAILTININDMGHYGCQSDCAERISMPLYAEATVKLIRTSPMSSLAANSLGSAIIIEFLMVLCLGVILLFFTCKCAILLVNERKNSYNTQSSQPSKAQSLQKKNSGTDLSENATHFAPCCSSPFFLTGQTWNFRRRQKQVEESGKETLKSSATSSHHHLQTLPPFSIDKKQDETNH